MAKMKCECGLVFRFGEGSLPGEHLLVPDRVIATLLDQEGPVDTEELIDRLDQGSRAAFFCQSCDRLFLERVGSGEKTRFAVYRPCP